MPKKTTLEDLAAMLTKHGKELHDLTESLQFVMKHMATKEQLVALHTQVNGIEADIKTMKGYKLVTRVADLEEAVFGKARG